MCGKSISEQSRVTVQHYSIRVIDHYYRPRRLGVEQGYVAHYQMGSLYRGLLVTNAYAVSISIPERGPLQTEIIDTSYPDGRTRTINHHQAHHREMIQRTEQLLAHYVEQVAA